MNIELVLKKKADKTELLIKENAELKLGLEELRKYKQLHEKTKKFKMQFFLPILIFY